MGAHVAGRRALGYKLADDSAVGLYELICGQPYFNLEVDIATFNVGIPMDVDDVIRRVSEDPSRSNYPEFGLYQQTFVETNHTGLRDTVEEFLHQDSSHNVSSDNTSDNIGRRFHESMVAAGQALLDRFAGDIEPGLRQAVAQARQELHAESSVPELVAAVGRGIDRLKRGSCVQLVRILHKRGWASASPRCKVAVRDSRIILAIPLSPRGCCRVWKAAASRSRRSTSNASPLDKLRAMLFCRTMGI